MMFRCFCLLFASVIASQSYADVHGREDVWPDPYSDRTQVEIPYYPDEQYEDFDEPDQYVIIRRRQPQIWDFFPHHHHHHRYHRHYRAYG